MNRTNEHIMVKLLRAVKQIDDGTASRRNDRREIGVPHATERMPARNELDHLRDVEALFREIVLERVEAV
jgi:hypothetical protein